MRALTYAVVAIALVLGGLPLEARVQKAKPEAAAKPAAQIDLNSATVEQLEALPGIGRSTAERIVEQRQKSGGFKKIEDVMTIKGIGEKSFLKLKPMITVTPRTEKSTGGA